MARCRCDSEVCGCTLVAGVGINVAGTGDATSPWIVSALPGCVACGTPANPGDVLAWDADLRLRANAADRNTRELHRLRYRG